MGSTGNKHNCHFRNRFYRPLCIAGFRSHVFGARNEKWDHLQDLKGVELVPLLVLGLAIFIGGFRPYPMDLINNG